MTVEEQVRGAHVTLQSTYAVAPPRENWNAPLILAIAAVFFAAVTSLWTRSRPEATAESKELAAPRDDVRVSERPTIRAISVNHQAEYLDVLHGQAGWNRRDAHTGRILTQAQLAPHWLVHLQLRSEDDTWAAVTLSNELELVHAGEPLWQAPLPDQRHGDQLSGCTLSTNQNLAAVFSKSGTLWLVEFDEDSAAVRGRHQFDEPLAAVSLSPNGDRLLLITGRHELLIWNVEETQIERRIAGEQAGLRFVTWSGDGRRFAAFGSNRQLEVRDADGKLVRQIELTSHAVVSAVFSHDGSRLAVGDGTVLRLWRLDSQAEAYSLDGHESLITALAFDDQTRALFSGDTQGVLRRWALLDHREVWLAH